MTESEEKQNQDPLFKKGEIHHLSTPTTVMIPGVGFAPAPNVASMTWGDEEAILNKLRAMGFSEEAVAAFKSGKIVQGKFQQTPFGNMITSETWLGKEEEKKEEEKKIDTDQNS